MALTAAQWPAQKARDTFLKFFTDRGHTLVSSSSVIPFNDNSLLFTNAGMNQYKPIFLETVDPQSDFGRLKRSTNTQKCIRAGGKHNDLDDVGKDSYHHTFFEMLGNWSFGDYFKKEAITYSWELLTEVYGLDPDRLYVTYFEGYAPSGLDPDDEAKNLWREIGVADDHIIPGNMKDNFWEMGDQGPCGPCIELHYDLIGGRNAAHLVNQDDPHVVEIWNVVFIQFNRESDKSLRLLPNKHIDTGLGFERLLAALQSKTSNYDTDLFTPLFDRIQQVTGARPYQGNFGDDDADGIDTAYRVIADHVRTSTIAISDGVVPGNVGRGYIVRRILRRGARYGRKYFQAEIGSFFSKIVPTVIEHMGDTFSEIRQRREEVQAILDEEERAFAVTLDRGEAMFNKYAQSCRDNNLKGLPGTYVWRLYDTYGFPIDLTKLMAEEQGLAVDDEEVTMAQEHAREASKGQKAEVSDRLILDVHDIVQLQQKDMLSATKDDAKYDTASITATVKSVYYDKTFLSTTSSVPRDHQVGILLDRTNFYAESGGQTFDTGTLTIEGVSQMHVKNVQSYGGYVLHIGQVASGNLSVGDQIVAEYDESRREPIRLNHTGTHVLNFALRETLGSGIEQKGSLVAPDKLRFDFSYREGLKSEELMQIERVTTKYIGENHAVYSADVDLSIARKIEGVRAVFGESYPDPVRVVSIGKAIDHILSDPAAEGWRKYSIEFCGGTHVLQTGQVEDLVVLEENGIAKGVRRIVAVTGQDAVKARVLASSFEERVAHLEAMANNAEKEVMVKEVQLELSESDIAALAKRDLTPRLVKVAKDVLKGLKEAQKAQVEDVLSAVQKHFQDNEASTFHVAKLQPNTSAKVVSDALKHVSGGDKSVYLIAADNTGGKVAHGCFIAPLHVSKGFSANEWAGKVAEIVGGKAGGKGATCVGSGSRLGKVDDGVAAAIQYMERCKIGSEAEEGA